MDNNKVVKRTAAGVVTSLFVISNILPTVVQAASIASNKEEVVYVNLNSDGDLLGTYVVNIFNDSDITDYGNYIEVRNMNTNDEINYDSGVIKIKSSKDKLYYEGIMENAEIPWNIDITYKMDGKEYSPEEIAGMSGKLTIEINITENTKAKEGFFESYALQSTVKLDTNICKNIVSEGATVANAGDLKQLTYTVMPGNEKDIKISADVTDFEMDGIDINGIKLNLGISKENVDTSNLSDKITELQDAVSELDNGAKDLNDGAETLNSGAGKLNDGINTINEALNTLNGKSSSLTNGSSEVKTALETIDSALSGVTISSGEITKLSDASAQIKNGIAMLVGGLQSIDGSIDTYYGVLSQNGLTDINDFINSHNNAIAALGITDTQRNLYSAYVNGGIEGVQASLGQLVASGDTEAVALFNQYASGDTNAVVNYVTTAGKLISVEALLSADVAYIQGSQALIGGIDSALDSESGELMTGVTALQQNYEVFDASIQNLVSSLGNLLVNMNDLKNGINLLTENYSTLDSGINEYTNAVNSITMGYNQICNGALDLVNGTSELYNGTKTMAEGTGEFSKETSGLQDEVDEQIDSMLEKFTGSDSEVVSFVSEKNTNVESVQFVIKTTGVEKATVTEEKIQVEENLNMLQKFLRLFKLY
ncbi:hypothetical protein LQE93_15525 [Clostridium sp. NSJ-145]|uniref:hypothetical protein n=1 Tax=Clostridium sp. NSJ-145 TaxID=2897777 RepID=UPI001E61323A|nr:hypothetical protein [Clostridium sp. NSJ-145]MCD2503171.1 hypothetical protein [Clostridium sp. NSJ-145]